MRIGLPIAPPYREDERERKRERGGGRERERGSYAELKGSL